MKYNSIKIKTPLGTMIATGDEQYIYSLNFSNNAHLHNNSTAALELLKEEVDLYFQKKLKKFKSKLAPQGTIFQKKSGTLYKIFLMGKHRTMKPSQEISNKICLLEQWLMQMHKIRY